MSIQILCLDNSKFAEHDAVNRGYRGDIYVKIKDNYFKLNIFDICRLQQDFELELKEYGIFYPEPNLIIVREVNNGNVQEIINHLIKCNYFNKIQPVSQDIVNELNLLEL